MSRTSTSSQQANTAPNTTRIVETTVDPNNAALLTFDENVVNNANADDALLLDSSDVEEVVEALDKIGELTKHKNGLRENVGRCHVHTWCVRVRSNQKEEGKLLPTSLLFLFSAGAAFTCEDGACNL